MRDKINKILIVFLFLLVALPSVAQEGGASGSYSPYSVYGIGNLSKDGTAYNRSMGGIGVANRNRRFLNTLNPAAVTARDTLSFMADFGLKQGNNIYTQKVDGQKIHSGKNSCNISDFVMSFPIWRSSAFMIGITPFSDLGYSYTSSVKDDNIIGEINNVNYSSYGEGGMYQVFLAAGVTFWKRLSLGAQANYYFGTIDKVTNQVYTATDIRYISGGNNITLRGLTGKFGIQYEQPLASNISMTVGATYRMKTNLKGYASSYRYATLSSVVDTLKNTVDTLGYSSKVSFGDEIGVGISINGGERWSVEFDYIRQGWQNSNFDSVAGLGIKPLNSKFTASASNSFRAGFEFTPNRNDVRYYFRKCTYRAGLYYEEQYYRLDGNIIADKGLTLGITLPVFKWYNGITVGLDLGQRGSLRPIADPSKTMIKENYITFNIGFNIHDIWFRKSFYE